MNILSKRICAVILGLCTTSASTVLAESVNLKFSTACFIATPAGERNTTEGSKFVFSSLRFGGACGTAVSNYQKGLTSNNALAKGIQCSISGILKRRSGRAAANTKILVKNELGTVRASKKTDAFGKFSMTFKTLDINPGRYDIFGPLESKDGARIGCTIYNFQHAV